MVVLPDSNDVIALFEQNSKSYLVKHSSQEKGKIVKTVVLKDFEGNFIRPMSHTLDSILVGW